MLHKVTKTYIYGTTNFSINLENFYVDFDLEGKYRVQRFLYCTFHPDFRELCFYAEDTT